MKNQFCHVICCVLPNRVYKNGQLGFKWCLINFLPWKKVCLLKTQIHSEAHQLKHTIPYWINLYRLCFIFLRAVPSDPSSHRATVDHPNTVERNFYAVYLPEQVKRNVVWSPYVCSQRRYEGFFFLFASKLWVKLFPLFGHVTARIIYLFLSFYNGKNTSSTCIVCGLIKNRYYLT